MSQSSIEYLMEMIRLNGKDFYAMLLDDKVFEKAKEMHKEEIEDAYDDGSYDEYEYHINNYPRKISEDYYNEKFNK